MNFNLISLLSLFLIVGCFNPKPRQPITYTSGKDQAASIAFNKQLYTQENKQLQNYITADSLHTYSNSSYGFWYAITNDINSQAFAVKGDKVTYTYAVYDLNNQEIYSQDVIGVQTYYIEQQEIIQGLQEGLKLLNKGENVIFLLPSHMAYGYNGDKKDIGTNTPIVIKLDLLDINKTE